jgi:hypothetical protein
VGNTKGKIVKIYFRPEEEYLYLRLLSMTKRTKKGRNWGISEYTKQLYKLHLCPENMNREMLFEFAYKEIFGWRCGICGGRGRARFLFDEGDKLRVQIECASGMGHRMESTDLIWINYPQDPKLREELKQWIQERTGRQIQPWPPQKTETDASRYQFSTKPF